MTYLFLIITTATSKAAKMMTIIPTGTPTAIAVLLSLSASKNYTNKSLKINFRGGKEKYLDKKI